jgi:hypothetical protein
MKRQQVHSEGEEERKERLDRLELDLSEAEAGRAELEEKASQMSEMLAAQNSLIITLKTKCQQFNKVCFASLAPSLSTCSRLFSSLLITPPSHSNSHSYHSYHAPTPLSRSRAKRMIR